MEALTRPVHQPRTPAKAPKSPKPKAAKSPKLPKRAALAELPEDPDFPRLPPDDLLEDDGVPLETNWHRLAMNLLIELIRSHWRDRSDFFAGGNMFVYFDLDVALRHRARRPRRDEYRGPDVFVVRNVEDHDRRYWAAWNEGGRYPDVIIELSSPSTWKNDLTLKKDVYESVFKTADYFVYDPDRDALVGWHLHEGTYAPLEPNEQGWLWSEGLGLWLGRWQGTFLGATRAWLRLYTPAGVLVPTFAEAETQRAEAETQRAEAEAQRAEAAEVEVARLRALLERHGIAETRE